MKKIMGVFFFVFMTFCMLTNSSLSLAYAALGLRLWYEKMVPVLFPFMVLSGTLIRMGLVESLIRPIRPFFSKLFRISDPAVYTILMGFLCGFPMGARTTAELRNRQELSVSEGQYLLAFCNNFGPVYFLGFVLPLLHRTLKLPYLMGMYGIPVIYGLFLRYTVYRMRLQDTSMVSQPATKSSVRASLPDALDDAVNAAGLSILHLGGYMIFFNLLNLLPGLFLRQSQLLAPLLEITGGLQMLADRYPLYTLLLLSFGGLSGIAQTAGCIRNTGLSLKKYIIHKLVLTLLTAFYYLGWRLLSPDTFLL